MYIVPASVSRLSLTAAVFSFCAVSLNLSMLYFTPPPPLKLEAIIRLMWLITCAVTPWHFKYIFLYQKK